MALEKRYNPADNLLSQKAGLISYKSRSIKNLKKAKEALANFQNEC